MFASVTDGGLTMAFARVSATPLLRFRAGPDLLGCRLKLVVVTGHDLQADPFSAPEHTHVDRVSGDPVGQLLLNIVHAMYVGPIDAQDEISCPHACRAAGQSGPTDTTSTACSPTGSWQRTRRRSTCLPVPRCPNNPVAHAHG